jgi:hypothetical protein
VRLPVLVFVEFGSLNPGEVKERKGMMNLEKENKKVIYFPR